MPATHQLKRGKLTVMLFLAQKCEKIWEMPCRHKKQPMLSLKVGGQPRQMFVEIMKKEQLALMLPRPGNKQTTIHSKHWPIKPKLRPKNKPKWPKLRPKPKLNPHQIDLITHLVLGYAFPLFHLCHHRPKRDPWCNNVVFCLLLKLPQDPNYPVASQYLELNLILQLSRNQQQVMYQLHLNLCKCSIP